MEELEINKYDFKSVNINGKTNKIRNPETDIIKNLLNDIKRHHELELKTNNEYAFNLKEADGMYYNITPSFELNYNLFNSTSLQQITRIIQAVINLKNAQCFRLIKLKQNELLNIEFDYLCEIKNVGISELFVINVIICISKSAVNASDIVHIMIYKDYEVQESIPLFSFNELLETKLNLICENGWVEEKLL